MDTLTKVYIAISIFAILISCLPLINDVTSDNRWVGYGWGAYRYENNVYSVSISEVMYGGDKPKIKIYPPYLLSKPVDLVEFSGHESFIDEYNIYRDAVNITASVVHKNVLELTYVYPNGKILKQIIITGDNNVTVVYQSQSPAKFRITIWRWYYDSVNGITFKDMGSQDKVLLGELRNVSITFSDKVYGNGSGWIVVNVPVLVYVWRDKMGINKIEYMAENVTELSFTVVGFLEPIKRSSSITTHILALLSVRGVYYLLPMVTVAILALMYAGLRKLLKESREMLKLLLVAILIRVAFAPFFAHIWDINTIQTSLYQLMSGFNPYEHTYNMTLKLRAATGLAVNFEGYAYLPHVFLIFFPFYAAYLAIGGEPLPIRGVSDPAHPLTVFFHPDVFLFLLLIKMPIILADALIAFTLYRYFDRRAAWLYALAPYSVFISSVWGMFDSIVALFLLLTVLFLRKRYHFLAGLSYGFSLMKFYTVFAIVPILHNVMKDGPKALLNFVAGITLSQIYTLYFFTLNPKAFLASTVLFHNERFGGGVNPLNVLWTIQDLGFNIEVSKYISFASLVIWCFVSLLVVIRGIELRKSVVLTMLTGLFLGKITNEQYLASIYPLLLLISEDLARRLGIYITIFGLLNASIVYFALPMIGLAERSLAEKLYASYTSILYREEIFALRYLALYVLALIVFIRVATAITIHLLYERR